MSLFIPPVVRATDANNDALSGALMYFYVSGTTTAAAIYTDAELTTEHTNPVVADAAGLFAPIYLNPPVNYRVTLKTSAGALIQDIDPYNRVAPLSTLADFGAAGDGGSAVTPLTNLFAASSSALIPTGSYALATDVTVPNGPFSWRMQPGVSWTGAGTILTPNLPGYNYSDDLRYIPIAESVGTSSVPVTHAHPVELLSKDSNSVDVTGAENPAHVVQHNYYGTTANGRAQASYLEAVLRGTGHALAFVEGLRTHGIVSSGSMGSSYGIISYAENNTTGLYNIGQESEIRRTVSGGNIGKTARTWTSTDNFDVCYNATINTANGAVGGAGGKANAAYAVNPFNSIAARTGFLVPKSVVSGKTVDTAAFQCLETGLVYGLDLAKGSYSTAAIALPNNSKITAYNAAGDTELEIAKLDTSNVLQLGGGAIGVAVGGGTALTKIVAYTPSITPASVGAATIAEQTFTVTGLTTADKVIINPPAIANATGIVGARVSAADTLAIRFANPTAGALTPSSGTYTVLALRS